MNWKEFLEKEGANHTLDELCKILPKIKRGTIKCHCYNHGILYKKIRHTKAVAKRKELIKEGYFNADLYKHKTWLV